MGKNFQKARILHNHIKIIGQRDIEETIKHARLSCTYRAPILLNESFSEKPQRFVNCLTKSTYVRPHNHASTQHWELMSWVDGIVYVLFFDREGKITDKIKMCSHGARIIEIPPDIYHSFITPDYGAYLEIRNCAYDAEADRVYASWAPAEKSLEAENYLISLFEADEKCSIVVG